MQQQLLQAPSLSDIHQAHSLIKQYAHNTPVMSSRQVNERAGCEVFFKCENLQKVGAFKFRGATNAVMTLSDEEAKAGVATHSSGNHAQALALAAQMRGIPAYIVMPENAPKVKVDAVNDYGAKITFCEATLEARESTLEEVVTETGAAFIHPYNNSRIIAGQGTAALELLEAQPDLDLIMAPVGGGGLLSGTALSVKYTNPKVNVIGAEPELADDAFRSFNEGHRILNTNTATIADGLRTSLGELTFSIIQDHVDEIVTVSEESIISAMRFVWERMNIIIEPSSAVPVAALFDKKVDVSGQKAGIIISGGNIDLNHLPWQ